MTTTEHNSTNPRSCSLPRLLEVLRSGEHEGLQDYRLESLLWALMMGHVQPADIWPAIFANDLDALDDLIHDDEDEDSGPEVEPTPEHGPALYVPGYCSCGELSHDAPSAQPS